MEMTKQRKMLAGIMVLGLCGLALDRFVIGAPDAAEAEMEEITFEAPAFEPVAEDEPEPEVTGEQAKTLPSYSSLTERLLRAQEQGSAGVIPQGREDPFALPEQWQTDKTRPGIKQQEEPGQDDQQITRLFKLDGTVRSMINGKEEMLAVISGGGLDGRAIRIGQKVRVPGDNGTQDQYELVEVGSRYVIWKSQRTGKRIVMQVEEVL